MNNLTDAQKEIHAMLSKVLENNGHLPGCMDPDSPKYDRNADRAETGACDLIC